MFELQNQVKLYSLGIDSFFTPKERELNKKIKKCEFIKSGKPKRDKLSKRQILTIEVTDNQKKRLNKLIKYYKEQLDEEFVKNQSFNIVRELNEEDLTSKRLIAMFESTLTRAMGLKTNDLTTDFMVITVYHRKPAEDVIKRGFMYNGEKYVFYTASAGQIRQKKFVVIKENLLKKLSNTLMCGLSYDIINQKGGINTNKFLAYSALTTSATEVWEDFNIDQTVVVDDFETMVNGMVDYINMNDYSIERKEMYIPINHMDGAGIMIGQTTRMIRMPWVKGLMIEMPFDKFVIENNLSGDIIDIYGKKWNIFDDDIKYILTKSQFKLNKMYDNWDEYKENFKKYNCEACYCKMEQDKIYNSKLGYQMIQTLTDWTTKEVDKILEPTIKNINSIGGDFKTTMRIFGVNPDYSNQSWMQKSLYLYPELLREPNNKDILKSLKEKEVKEAKCGKININGKYTFVIPDVYAFCEWLFKGIAIPDGLLQNGEVSCNLFENNKKLDCLRSPHLMKEHSVRINVRNKEISKWFVTKGVYTSTKDLISKVLQFD